MFCTIEIKLNSNILKTNVIIDTGNFLREPITKIPVVVLEKNILSGIIPEYILNNTDKIITGENIYLEDFASKIRIIPFSSLGKENGIMLGIKSDGIKINTYGNEVNVNNVIIGIYNGILNKSGKYHGLIGLDIMEESNSLIYN